MGYHNPFRHTPQAQRNQFRAGPSGVRRAKGVTLRGYVMDAYYNADETGAPADPVQGVLCDVQIIEAGYRGLMTRVPVMTQSGGYANIEHWRPQKVTENVKGGQLVDEGAGATPTHEMNGDLVVVGFLGDNLNNPYIMGQLPHPEAQSGAPDDPGYPYKRVLEGNVLGVDDDGVVRIDITDGTAGTIEIVADSTTITVQTDGTVVIDGGDVTITDGSLRVEASPTSVNVQPVVLNQYASDLGLVLTEWGALLQTLAGVFGVSLPNTVAYLVSLAAVTSASLPYTSSNTETD